MPKPGSQSHALDLIAIAHQSMIEAGFAPDLNNTIAEEVQSIAALQSSSFDSSVRDLRELLWSSIDDKKSRDLDQVEYAEELPDGDTKLFIGSPTLTQLYPGILQLISTQLKIPHPCMWELKHSVSSEQGALRN